MPFNKQVAANLDTQPKQPEQEARLKFPAHAEAVEDIAPLAELNLRHVEALCEGVLELCAEPLVFDELLKRVFDRWALQLTMEQYVLVGSTVKSILSWHLDAGRAEALIEENRLLWHKT